jgi:hypothetical protein
MSASTAASSPHLVSGLNRTSAVVGVVDCEISRVEADVVVEGCTDSTVFVTASLRSLTLRGLTRCTIIAAPSTTTVSLTSCTECVVSVAAPSVAAGDLVGCLLFVASRTPVSVGGSSRDVRMGPYNVVGDGLLSNSGMREWALGGRGGGGSSSGGGGSGSGGGGGGGGSGSGGGGSGGSGGGASAGGAADTFCRLDSAGSACVRAITPADFFWRFLPVPQSRNERLPLPAAYATPELPPDLARLDTTRESSRSQRIETLTQMKFVVRLVFTNSRPLFIPSALTHALSATQPTLPPSLSMRAALDAKRQQGSRAQKRLSTNAIAQLQRC